MSDTEYEYFEVTNFDLDNEFNPNRRRRKLTKNQQIYGNFIHFLFHTFVIRKLYTL